ncbi:MAG TPA: hypothetical protein VHL61_11195 [Luteimonas sp.]|jgi:hypothetical protein|nr:hypothetical protein [Luteimonas sp.]
MRMRLSVFVLLLCGAFPAGAVVRRCVATDGTLVFTDRRCADVGAVERAPPSATVSAAPRTYRNACLRSLRDLVDELNLAIDSRDVNRLAGLYDWAGLSTRSGYQVMDRLQRIVERPLVDITPLGNGAADDGGVRHAPTGLRLEQTLANGSTPAQTVLGLRRAQQCWWITL